MEQSQAEVRFLLFALSSLRSWLVNYSRDLSPTEWIGELGKSEAGCSGGRGRGAERISEVRKSEARGGGGESTKREEVSSDGAGVAIVEDAQT